MNWRCISDFEISCNAIVFSDGTDHRLFLDTVIKFTDEFPLTSSVVWWDDADGDCTAMFLFETAIQIYDCTRIFFGKEDCSFSFYSVPIEFLSQNYSGRHIKDHSLTKYVEKE